MCVIPRARATSLSAEMNTSGLGSSNAAARYSVQCASLFRYSTASNGAYWVIEYSPDQAHAPSRGLREYPVFGWIYFRLEAAHRPANRGECSQAITRAEMNPHLKNAFSNGFRIPEVAEFVFLDARQYARLSANVFQCAEPGIKFARSENRIHLR